jgi:PPP family 3-phenylpropionic acid transporter
MLGAVAWLSFFSTAQMPMAVAVSLTLIARDHKRTPFGHVRVWGTLGFFLTVIGVPPLVHFLAERANTPESAQFHQVFGLAGGLACLASLITLSIPSVPVHERARMLRGEQRVLLSHAPYLRVLAVVALAYTFLQGPLVLFPVYVHSRGGTHATISYMWSFSLTMETVLMFSSAALYKRFGPRPTIAFGVVACGVRWLLCGISRDLDVVYPLQLLHGAMVTSLQVGAPLLVESLVPERLRASSQAGLNMVGPGLGGIISSTLAGFAMDAWGIDAVMLVGGAAGLVLGLAAPWILPEAGTAASAAPAQSP